MDHIGERTTPAPPPPDDDPWAEMVAAGKMIPATVRFEDLPPPLPLPDDGGPTLSEILQQMRDEDDR